LRLLRLSGRALGAIRLFGALAIPAPDRPVVRPAIFFAFEVEAGNVAEDVHPDAGVTSNLDLRFDGPKRIDRLVEQIAHDAVLWLVAGGADVADRQVVVHAHVALDKTSDLPVVGGAIVALQNEEVAAAGGALIAFPSPLMVGVSQSGADRVAEPRCIAGLGSADAVGQTSFFHGASLRTA
jgi:hypothetical protein